MAVGFGRRISSVGCALLAFAAVAQERAPAPTSSPAPTAAPPATPAATPAPAPAPAPVPSAAAFAASKAAFVDKMVKQHEFDRAELTALLDEAQIVQTVLDAMSRPAERVVPWFEYRKIFLTEERIAAGAQFWGEHAKTSNRRAALRRGAGDDRCHRRRRNLFRHAHGQVPRARCAGDACVRVSRRARRFSPPSSSSSCCSRARSTSTRRQRSARMPAPWVLGNSSRRAIARMRWMPTTTASAICGTTGTTRSAASRTISRRRLADRPARRGTGDAWPEIHGGGAAQQSGSEGHGRLAAARWLRVHHRLAGRGARRTVWARSRRRRLGVLGGFPQFPRDHALQPQPEVRARRVSSSGQAIRARYEAKTAVAMKPGAWSE